MEPLVLVPGMMCDARLFAPQINALSRDMPVTVVPNTLGERIEEIASAILLGLPQKFTLAGLSMGGIIAMEIIRRAPERVTRIALMDMNPLPETLQSASAYEPLIVGAKAGRFEEMMRAILKPDHLAPGPQRLQIMNVVAEMGRSMGPEVFIRQCRALQRRRDQQATLRRIKAPALVLCGEHDGLKPVRRHTFMAELIPYAKLEIIEGAGHLPTLEQPEAVTDVLRAWMKQPYVLK